MLGFKKGRATPNDFGVVIIHQRKIAVNAAAADATKQGGKVTSGEDKQG